jgi:hypothetical protein
LDHGAGGRLRNRLRGCGFRRRLLLDLVSLLLGYDPLFDEQPEQCVVFSLLCKDRAASGQGTDDK